MKKCRLISLILCLTLILGFCLPGAYGESPEDSSGVEESTDIPFGQVCVQNGCRTVEAKRPLAGSERKLSTAQGAMLYEMNTDTVIYAYNADTKLPLGSLTKVITAIVALQYCHVEDTVTIEPGIKGRLPVSKMNLNLTNDEIISVEYLLEGLLVYGTTDAAVALAEYVSGNRQAFIPLMNQWVNSIGCTGTEVSTVHGVDGGTSYTTPRDMIKIIQEAMKNEDFSRIFAMPECTIPATNKSEERSYKTLNYMRDTSIIETFYDRNITGGFASYEESSGANLVVTKDYKNMHCIGVVLGCEREFSETKSWVVVTYGNFENMVEMLKFGYENYKVNRVIYDGMTLSQFRVTGGECNAVGQANVNVDSVIPISAQMNNLTVNYYTGDQLSAPIQKGEKIGTVEMWYRDSCLAEAEIYSMGEVKQASNTGVLVHTVALRAESDRSGILSVVGTVCLVVLGVVAAYLCFNTYMRYRIRVQRRRRRAGRRRTR